MNKMKGGETGQPLQIREARAKIVMRIIGLRTPRLAAQFPVEAEIERVDMIERP